jgi:hypothetical protein
LGGGVACGQGLTLTLEEKKKKEVKKCLKNYKWVCPTQTIDLLPPLTKKIYILALG